MTCKQFEIAFADDPDGVAMVEAVCRANEAAEEKEKANTVDTEMKRIEDLLTTIYATRK